jgi:pyruvate/2-oxoglutarate dehydrogenase complex dihydrolipoamide dehydrogenase (E3) component
MAAIEEFDAVVIGSGQGGGPLAGDLAKAGRKTALIERVHVGGTCINEGCTPTKTMVASARVAYLARRAADYGVGTGPVTVDMQKVRQRKRDMVDSFRSSSERRLTDVPNLSLVMGEARFTGPKTIEVKLRAGGSRMLRAENFFLNVGARPAAPQLPGLEKVQALDSTSIMELDVVPEHLMVVGGGYVGLEFGQMFRRFGSRVTIIQREARLLGREDADVADAVAKLMREDGLELLLESSPTRVEQLSGNKIRLTVKGPGGEQTLVGSHLLLAAGRAPNSDTLHLEAAGVMTDARGLIQVNERLETNVAGIYALGDVKGGPAFTHISYDDYRIIRTNLLEGGQASTQGRFVPYTVFIDPQLGRVGMTEEEARASGRKIKVARMPMNYITRAVEVDEPRGMLKVVVDAGSSQILGCAILGIEGGEIMAMLQIAMMGKLPYPALREATFAHPTLSEGLNNLFSSFDKES